MRHSQRPDKKLLGFNGLTKQKVRHHQSCANTVSFTDGTVIYGVIWTPSYRRIRCFLTIYAIIYVFHCHTRTVL